MSQYTSFAPTPPGILIQYTPLWEFGFAARIADALAAKKKGCGCGGAKKGTKVVVAPPVPMEEAPDPRPEFAERTIEVVDSGRMLEPTPIDSEGTLFK